jgi:hypothetical protein
MLDIFHVSTDLFMLSHIYIPTWKCTLCICHERIKESVTKIDVSDVWIFSMFCKECFIQQSLYT